MRLSFALAGEIFAVAAVEAGLVARVPLHGDLSRVEPRQHGRQLFNLCLTLGVSTSSAFFVMQIAARICHVVAAED